MGNVYYIRAFATNEKGTSYGEELPLDMNAIMPEVVTEEPEILSNTSVILNGTVTEVGDPAYTERGFVYGTMLIPSLENGAIKIVAEGTVSGVFNAEVLGMDPQEIYNVRAYVKSQAGVVYGEIKTIIDPEFREYRTLPTFIHDGQVYRVYPDLGSAMTWAQANQACEDLTFAGYNDWILPSKGILNTMYINKDEIGGFNESFYWSTTYYYNSYHDFEYWVQHFSNGVQELYEENALGLARPVRLEQ